MKALLFFLVASFAGQALAQNNSPSQNAEIVTKLFMSSCMSSPGNNKAASAWAKENKLISANQDFSRKILRDKSGEVWGLGGQFLLVLSGENHCSVWAKTADASQVNKNFERLVMGVARPGLTVKPYIDKIFDGAGGKYRQYGFTIQKDGESSGAMMLSTTSESSQAEVQIRLTLSLVKL